MKICLNCYWKSIKTLWKTWDFKISTLSLYCYVHRLLASNNLLAIQSLVNCGPLIDGSWQYDVKSTFLQISTRLMRIIVSSNLLKSWNIGIQATIFCSVANYWNFIILHGKVKQSRLQNTWRKRTTSQKSMKKTKVIGENIQINFCNFSASAKQTPPTWVFINTSYKTKIFGCISTISYATWNCKTLRPMKNSFTWGKGYHISFIK